MVLILCIGDLHIPHRAADIPSKFKSLLVPGKIHKILCTGNLCDDATFDYLRSICSDITLAYGPFDQLGSSTHRTETSKTHHTDVEVTKIGDFRVGVASGQLVPSVYDKEALAIIPRRLGLDLLVVGGTHRFESYKIDEGCFVICPGTATGAFSVGLEQQADGQEDKQSSSVPSFALLDVNTSRATVYVYQLVDDDVKVEKIEFIKEEASS